MYGVDWPIEQPDARLITKFCNKEFRHKSNKSVWSMTNRAISATDKDSINNKKTTNIRVCVAQHNHLNDYQISYFSEFCIDMCGIL